MHVMPSRRWRHRLLVLHVAAGAGVLGAAVLLMVANGFDFAGASAPVALLLAHLALLAVVLGLLAFMRLSDRRSNRISRNGVGPASPHRTPTNERSA